MQKPAFNKLASLLVLILSAPIVAAQTESRMTPDSIHIQRCSACHYVDGKSPGPEFPNIAGQYEDYLLKALKLFKENKRDSDAMELLASLHKQQELVILAHHYAQQKAASGTPSPDPATMTHGQRIYTSERVYGISCADCHGADAKGYIRGTPRSPVIRSIPRLAGQQPGYLKAVLQKYTGNDVQPGMCAMRKAGKTLDSNDINALVDYLSSK
jgi:cytochrome c553